MNKKHAIFAIVPAFDEAEAIGQVVSGLLSLKDESGQPLVARVVVADNGSTDGTGAIALSAGAIVVREPRRGYGYACMAAISAAEGADILLFVDGDNSIVLNETPALLAALDSKTDLVIGARAHTQAGAMTLPQRFGNGLACFITRRVWGVPISDLGPFRAIRKTAFEQLDMKDMTYGWTIEMQIKAFQQGQRVTEVPVSLRCRLGRSKISGTVKGVIGAGIGILSMIAKLWWRERTQGTRHQPRVRRV